MPLARLGDRSLSFRRGGRGEPLLLIQGMAGHVGMWGEPLLAALEHDFDVLAYDHRGIGESSEVPGAFTIADLADDAAALMDALGWGSAHVFGISMGGMVAQELVLCFPERVRRLVLGCTYAGGSGAQIVAPGPLRIFEAMQTGDLDLAVRAGFEANVSGEFAADPAHYETFKQAVLAERVPVPLVLAQAQACFAHDASARLGTVTAPTLVLHGTADQMVLYPNAEHVASLIPGARLHTFPGAGHLFYWEQPDRTAALLREHLVG
ncbi:MAG: alpha/beta fold hydrolase [Jatrophihabitans sp.]|nr:MAG: alpha/beta fold hydrolase [Jatrophihabitans sp.]